MSKGTNMNKIIKSDLKRLEAMRDEDIDLSDIPELDEGFWKQAKPVIPPGKKQLTLRIDDDVFKWFKGQGRGYQSRMNAVLRSYYESHQNQA